MNKKAIIAICAALSVGCATQPQGHRTLVDTYAPGFSHYIDLLIELEGKK